MKNKRNTTKWIYWFTFAVAVIFVYKTLDNFNDIAIWIGGLKAILMPFVFGILIAYLLYIPCRGIEKVFNKNKFLKKHSRGLAVLFTYILIVLIIIFIINIMIPAISESVLDLSVNLPNYYQMTIDYIDEIPDDFIISKESIQDAIGNLEKIDITKILNIENITDYVEKAASLVSIIFNIFVTLIISIYVLLERKEILQFMKRLCKAIFKNSTYEALDGYFAKTNDIFFKFIASQVIDGIIMGIFASIAMWIMGVKYSILLGFIIGLFNIIPYFGAIISIVIAGIITIFTGGIGQAIWMVIVVTILQQIDANIINPKILGNALKISPILVIFSITLFGTYFKFLGMFLAVPAIAVIKILINDYIDYKIKLKEEN